MVQGSEEVVETMSYRLAARAIADLDEIRRFIEVEKGNPKGAEIVSDYLFAASEAIGRDPNGSRGRARPEITDKSVKFLAVRKYVVIYDDRVDPIRILGVAGVRQNLPQLLSEDVRYIDDV